MVYILWGEDDFSLNQALKEIKRGLGDEEFLETNTTVLDGKNLSPDELALILNATPFLSEKRLVIVKGLLGRFEVNGAKRGKKQSGLEGEEKVKPVAECISRMPESTVLILIEERVSGRNPLFSALAPLAQVKAFPLLKGRQLESWVKRWVERNGGSISPQAALELSRLVGSNLWVMASEIDKLISYTGGRRIELEDVNKLVSYAQQTSIFTMVDAILESKAALAQSLLQRLLREGVSPPHLLFVLSRQLHRVLRAKVLKEQGVSDSQIQSRLNITQDFVLRKTLEQAQRFSLNKLKMIYPRLLEADLSIKTGKLGGELALDLLVAELCSPGG